MIVCNSLAQLPTEGCYRLALDDAEHRLLQRFIEVFRPGLHYDGIAVGDAGDAHVLVASPRWKQVLADLGRLGVAEGRAIVVLMPFGDYCGWSDFFAPLLDRIRPAAGGFVVPWEAFHARMRDLRFASTGKLGRMLLEPARYFSHTPPMLGSEKKVERVLAAMSPKHAAAYREMLALPPMAWIERYAAKIFNCVQYFEHIPLGEGDVIVNCGVCDGWEMPYFLSAIGETGRIYCIDPTGTTYLQPFPKACMEEHLDRITMVEVALMDFEGKGAARIKGNMAFVRPANDDIGPDESELSCTTLDALVERQGIERIDLIKIDIEGCEIPALRGMLGSIRRFRPSLALSVYHRPTDLWEIPHMILEAVDDYSIIVEPYCFNRSETIAYMIPRERQGRGLNWGIPGVAAQPIRLAIGQRVLGQLRASARWLTGAGA